MLPGAAEPWKTIAMIENWAPAIVFLTLSMTVGFAMIIGNKILAVRAKHDEPTKRMTYECGEDPAGPAWIRFHPRYYVVALVFILFDVETVFLVPWALNIRALGGFAIVEMFLFVGILLLGWIYALKKGGLRWQ